MDVDMPVMNGLETTKNLRNMIKNGEITDLKIIGCTAFAFQSEKDKCIEVGMDDCLTKPVSLQQLKDTLKKHQIKRDNV
jgi:CheY-like chemotaxis protein